MFPVLLAGVDVAVDKCICMVAHDFITTAARCFSGFSELNQKLNRDYKKKVVFDCETVLIPI